jgi:DNA-binding CsgD family transcriptional regulator
MSADALASVALRFSLEARVSTGTGHTSETPAPGREGVGRLEALLESYATDRALSGQQRIVLKLYLAGKNDKEIASECSCSEATVYEHWRRMARKAGGMHKGCVITDFHRFLDQL